MGISTTIDTKSLLKSLEQFPINIQKNVLTGAVRAGAKPLVDEARSRVPQNTKNLRKSIGITKRKTKNKNIVKFTVSPRKGGKNDGWYAHMIEYGHDIVKNKQVIGSVPPQPFMRTAYEAQDQQSIKAVQEYMAKRIDKEIAKSKAK